MRTALASAGPAIFASAATVIAALLCLMIAKVNGTAGLGPIAAIGIACAALSMLTLLPALLTIFGRRAFWPFVPHTPETAPAADDISDRARSGSSKAPASALSLRVFLACLLVLVLLPLVLLNWILRRDQRRAHPLVDRRPARPCHLRPLRGAPPPARACRRRYPWVLETGRRPGRAPRRRIMVGSVVVLLIFCAGFAFFSTELTSEDSYRTEVESVEGQHLLDKSFPSGTTALTDIVVPDRGEVQAVRQCGGEGGRRRGCLAAGRRGAARHPGPGDAGTEPLLDRGLRPGRTDPRSGARSRPMPLSAGRRRSNSTSATRPAGTRSSSRRSSSSSSY